MGSRYRRRRKKTPSLKQPDVTAQTPPGGPVPEPAPVEAKPSTVELFAYGPHDMVEDPNATVEAIQNAVAHWPVTWVNIDGTGDGALVRRIGELFQLHELALEDILNLHQRAKVEEYDSFLFIVLRMAAWEQDHLTQEQLCIVVGENFVLTFQESAGGDPLLPVRERIRRKWGHIRTAGPDYLMYALVDAVVDGYFPVLESLGEALEELEDEILEKYDQLTPARILELKRDVITVRRAIWPAREALNVLIRDDLRGVEPKTKIYLRDCYDHVVRIIDLIETQREICSDLMDLFLSSTSNRMNEVMKVLTTITLLFMPPTLVAGIYGMNFNTQISPYNMPELNWPYGYFFSLLVMLSSALIVLSFARWRGWLRSDEVT